jgi:hypothetical protein
MAKPKRRHAPKGNGSRNQSATTNGNSDSSSSFQPLNMFFGPRTAGYASIPNVRKTKSCFSEKRAFCLLNNKIL